MIYHYQTLYCCGSIGDCNLSVIYVISEGNISCLNIKYNIQITESLLEEHCSNKLENIVGRKLWSWEWQREGKCKDLHEMKENCVRGDRLMRSNQNFLKSLRGRTKRRERENKTVGGICKVNFQPKWKLDWRRIKWTLKCLQVVSRTMLKAKLLGGWHLWWNIFAKVWSCASTICQETKQVGWWEVGVLYV